MYLKKTVEGCTACQCSVPVFVFAHTCRTGGVLRISKRWDPGLAGTVWLCGAYIPFHPTDIGIGPRRSAIQTSSQNQPNVKTHHSQRSKYSILWEVNYPPGLYSCHYYGVWIPSFQGLVGPKHC